MPKIFQKIRELNLTPWLIIYYLVGIAGILIPYTRELFIFLIPFNLLMNLGLLLIYHGPARRGFIITAFIIFSAGILIEMLGVNTGLIFGEYAYGNTLGPKVWHTPLMIGVNWFMLVYCTLVITGKFISASYFRIVIASVLMVVYDFVLEPSAIALGMWDWGGPVPLQNYLAWFLISFVLILVADLRKLVNVDNKIASPLFFVQMGFFILLNLHRFFIA